MSRVRTPAPHRILITTGDPDGVGFEVSAKALLAIASEKKCKKFQFVLFRGLDSPPSFEEKLLRKLRKKFLVKEYFSTAAAFPSFLSELPVRACSLVVVHSPDSPARWVEAAATACLRKQARALVTAPLSKPLIRAAGFKDLGHTEILKRVCGVREANMCFLGKNFNVVLATGHVPLKQIPQKLSKKVIAEAIKKADQIRSFLPTGRRRKPIAVLGLNPHAGDQGLIGDFERKTLVPLLKVLRARGLRLEGPLVPDAAFHPGQWAKYSFYVSLYHDQGLIPFKMAHGFDSGVHLTLGLPIWRTSVDHGTAKDIFGKDQANPGSMRDALLWALQLGR